MIFTCIFRLLFAAIALDGVSGDQLSASAAFDTCNARTGDPLLLTIDFTGAADFTTLHPPALSRAVDATLWKIDDESARTETWEGFGRRLVYRVRPLKSGLHVFPSLTFDYSRPAGRGTASFSTTPIPVHVKAGAQVALAGTYDGAAELPRPDGLFIDAPAGLAESEVFDWRKTCNEPTADGFAKFDFPAARLNEAACAVLEGNWARALKLYSRLEWSVGQTPTIERGIVAAYAVKTGDAGAELPVWRQVLRPVLRHAAAGRVLIAAGTAAGVALVLWLCGRLVRILAVVALAALIGPLPAAAADPFEMMEQRMQEMFNSVEGLHQRMTMSVNGIVRPEVEVKATLRTDRPDITQGEPFKFILALEAPKSCSFERLDVRPSEMYGLVFLANTFENLPDGVAANPSNVVKRMQLPVRYDVPFKSPVSFAVNGMVSSRQDGGGRSFFSFSTSFRVETPAIDIEVKPLPTENQPADFSGAIGTGFALTRSVNANRVETNDVITVVNTLSFNGFVPPGAVPDVIERRPGRLRWREYFVADGDAKEVPAGSFTFYDTGSKRYATVKSRPVPLAYVAATEAPAATVAVDAKESETESRAVKLRFFPRDTAPVVAVSTGARTVTETRGTWVRVDDGGHAGWVRKDELR